MFFSAWPRGTAHSLTRPLGCAATQQNKKGVRLLFFLRGLAERFTHSHAEQQKCINAICLLGSEARLPNKNRHGFLFTHAVCAAVVHVLRSNASSHHPLNGHGMPVACFGRPASLTPRTTKVREGPQFNQAFEQIHPRKRQYCLHTTQEQARHGPDLVENKSEVCHFIKGSRRLSHERARQRQKAPSSSVDVCVSELLFAGSP